MNSSPEVNRRLRLMTHIAAALAVASALAGPGFSLAADPDLAAIRSDVAKLYDESIKRLTHWIALPSIAAENPNSRENAEYMRKLAREAGFQKVEILDTDGKPGVFATIDAGAEKTVGLYFMCDASRTGEVRHVAGAGHEDG